jgi:signal peptidase I
MLKFLKIYLELSAAVVVLAAAAGLILWKTDGLRFYSVQTASMSPVLRPGDLVVSTKPQPKNLQVGDIISYASPQNPQKVITHRIYQANPAKGYLVTKGDNLDYQDPPIAYSSVTSKAAWALPKVGYGLDFLHRPIGLIGLVYLPALLITAYELQKLAARYSYARYHFNSSL